MRAILLALTVFVLTCPQAISVAGDDDVAAIYEAGRKAEAAKDFKTAYAKYDQVMDLDEDYKDVFERWEVCEKLAEWQEGLEDPSSPTAMDLVRLGEAYLELSRFEEECEAYAQALKLDAGCADAHGHLALAHYTNLDKGGDLVVVMEETTKFLETSEHRDHLKQAMADFEVFGLLRIMRQRLSDVLTEAGTARRKRDYGRAAEILKDAAGGEMPDAYRTVLYTEAAKLLLRSDRGAAREAFFEATKHASCTAVIEARMGLAAISVGEGKLEDALEHLGAAVKEGSDACLKIAAQKGKAFKPLFTSDKAEIREAAEALCDPEKADAPIRAQIAAACEKATKEEKKVLVVWYGPYCPYVMAMEERLAHPEVREILEKRFVLVRVDVGSHHRGDTVDAQYKVVEEDKSFTDSFGVPSFLVLNADGSVLSWEQDTNLMGADHRCYDVEKIVAWLTRTAGD